MKVEIVISNRGRIRVSRETQACRMMMMNMVNLKKSNVYYAFIICYILIYLILKPSL